MNSANSELLEAYLSERDVSSYTAQGYLKALKSWDRNTSKPLAEADQESLLRWFQAMRDRAKPGTIVKYATDLRGMYRYNLTRSGRSRRQAAAEAAELFDALPLSDLRRAEKRSQRLRDKLVTPAELKTLLEGTSSRRTRALLAVLYETGCRRGEVLSLRLRDVIRRSDHWVLRVEGKTGVRAVPVVASIPYLKAWLDQHPDIGNPEQYLFAVKRGGEIQALSPNGVNACLYSLCRRLGLRRIHPHMLRHTRLTKLAEEGLGEYQMKSFAGWTPSSSMAARYIHLTGTSHVGAVLSLQGVEAPEASEKASEEPYLKLEKCPKCGRKVAPGMVVCPWCEFILNEKVGIRRSQAVEDLEARVKHLEFMVEALRLKEKVSGSGL